MSARDIVFGSVCSGIEAASVAWSPLGWVAAWLAEIERFPVQLLHHHYRSGRPHHMPDPDEPGLDQETRDARTNAIKALASLPLVPSDSRAAPPNLGDMRMIPRLLRSGLIYPPDVFTGGTPCQAFSLAGLRASLEDARGNLSLTFCEIANEIDIQRAANGLLPCVVLWENVPGVLSTQDNAFGHFLAGLAGEDDPLVPPGQKWPDAGCVYGPQRTVAWRVQDAQYFGLAQRRRRVFVVASAREGFDPVQVLFEFDGVRRDTAPSRGAPQDAAGTVAGGARRRGGYSTDDIPLTAGTVTAANKADHAGSVAGKLVPLAFGGNRTSGAIDVSPALLASAKGPRLDFESDTFVLGEVSGTLTAQYGEQSGRDLAEMPGGLQLAPIAFDARQEPVSSTEVFGTLSSSSPQSQAVAHTLEASAGRSRGAGTPIGTLEPVLVFDPTQITSPANRSNPRPGDPCHTLPSHGHAPAVCITGDITHTLKAEGFDASEDGTGRGQPIVVAFQSSQSGVRISEVHATLDANNGPRRHNGALVGMAVRRLMPRECERLQGFPDDYTYIPIKRASSKAVVDEDGGVRLINGVLWKMAADGPRYKALGNSWAVMNVRWLGRRIDAQLRELERNAA